MPLRLTAQRSLRNRRLWPISALREFPLGYRPIAKLWAVLVGLPIGIGRPLQRRGWYA